MFNQINVKNSHRKGLLKRVSKLKIYDKSILVFEKEYS